MSKNLTEGENVTVGVLAAFVEGIILQPTLFWKNAKARNIPFTMNPRVIYRGTAASLYNEMQMMGLQFGLTGLFQRFDLGEYGAAMLGGATAAIFASPVELVMIQQQMFGGSVINTSKRIINDFGVKGMFRGLAPAMLRDALYVSGFLGITPLSQNYLMKEHNMSAVQSGFWASMLGGVAAAVPSHPLDLVKTCMQSDMKQESYRNMSQSFQLLWTQGKVRRMFAGCFWRSFNIIATVYIANECRNRFPPILFGKEAMDMN
jgi:solute carrier family 25 carnitine/acylcarnitine transporter 20/29